MLKLYLDSSVMIKRYLLEQGTETTDIIFDKAEAGELTVTVSIWNIEEALGVLDEKRRRGWLTEKERSSRESMCCAFVTSNFSLWQYHIFKRASEN